MANPRQRRKARSGTGKVRLAKHLNSRLKKVTPRNFPAPLADAYDRRQTPTQNYRRLGLLSGKLAPRLAGGIEKDTSLKSTWLNSSKQIDEFELMDTQDDDEDLGSDSGTLKEDEDAPGLEAEPFQKLSKGEGRIIRDENGKIIKIIIGEEAEIELPRDSNDDSPVLIKSNQSKSSEPPTPWGKPLDNQSYEKDPAEVIEPVIPKPVYQGIGYQCPRQGYVPPKTPFVEELAKISERRCQQYQKTISSQQHLSEYQIYWLQTLIDKHGIENVDRMAKDSKLNIQQKTEGEICRMLSRLKN